ALRRPPSAPAPPSGGFCFCGMQAASPAFAGMAIQGPDHEKISPGCHPLVVRPPPPRLESPCSTCAATCCPPLAVFAMGMSLPTAAHRQLAQLVAVFAMAGLLLGVAQIGMPRESLLNPYPQWVPAMSDLFANPNHQATLLAVAT